MDREARYAAAAAGDSEAIVDWEKEADLELNFRAIYHTITNYSDEHNEFIKEKLANKKLLFKVSEYDKETALHIAARWGNESVVRDLIYAATQLKPPSSNDIDPSHPISLLDDFVWQADRDKDTALHAALTEGHLDIARCLIEASPPPDGHNIKNVLGETPIYLAVKLGYADIVESMCKNWKDRLALDGPDDDSTTAVHTAIPHSNASSLADSWTSDPASQLIKSRKKDGMSFAGFDNIFEKTDKNYDTILSLSIREFRIPVVETILAEDPAYRNGRVRKSKDLKSMITLAAEKPNHKGYTYLVNLLTRSYEARKDIGHEHQSRLHVAIVKRDEDTVLSLFEVGSDPGIADAAYWTPLHYAAYYDFESILDATHVGYKPEQYEMANEAWLLPSPLHVAAREGHTFTVIKLMELLPTYSYVVADCLTHQNILHFAVLASEPDMIQHILKKCPEEYINMILNQQDVNGDTPLHLLIRDGCFVPELIKHEKVDRTLKNKQKWTSFDMLYFKDQIVADQVKVKKAVDDFQAQDQHQNFWQRFLENRGIIKKSKTKSLLAPSRLRRKDIRFVEGKKLLIKEILMQKKDELDRYRQRTNTQIIVTALITTVAFTVGFTMPGGYHQDGDLEGMVVLSNKKAFIAFMVSDALALLLSTSSLFLYFIASMYEDPHNVSRLNDASTVLNIISVVAMMLTFMTGTYVVLSHSRALAITVCVISSFLFLLVVTGLLIKWRYDRKQEKLHEV